MKAWKQVIMREVAQEIEAIRKGYEEAFETQRHDFQIELKRVNGRLNQIEGRSTTLLRGREKKMRAVCHNHTVAYRS